MTFRLVPVICVALCSIFAGAQTLPQPQGAPDPLAIGWKMLDKEQWTEAQEFFAARLQENANDKVALGGAGFAAFGQKQYGEAEADFKRAIQLDPAYWNAHRNLVEVYAAEGRWADFDAERSLLAVAKAKGLDKATSSVIEVFWLDGERYIVRAYDPLIGKFKARYNFTHFGADGKLDRWISCESDDVDQTFFAKAHPADAAAGKRSFSLDSYTALQPNGNGGFSQTHGTLRFYPDGEPTYETVRADVMKVLQHKSGMLSSTTVNGGKKDEAPAK